MKKQNSFEIQVILPFKFLNAFLIEEKENMNKSMMLPFKFRNLKRAKISRAQTRKLHSSLDSYDRYRNFTILPYVYI